MFSGIWTKISAGLAVIAGFFILKSKLQAHEIEELEEENAAETKKNVISNIVEAANKRAEENEEIKQADVDDSNWRNKI